MRQDSSYLKMRRNGNANKRKGMFKGDAQLSLTGSAYYEYSNSFLPDAGASVVDAPQAADFKLPVDRAFKVRQIIVTASTGYAAAPRRWRAQLGSTDLDEDLAGTKSAVLVPIARNTLRCVSRPSADFRVSPDGQLVIATSTFFANAGVEPIFVHYQLWADIGPPLTA